MYDKKINKEADRIVRINQPHVLSIVRGKVNAEVEFGNGKRKNGWSRISSKLKSTSETSIATTVLVMNLEKIRRDLLLSIFSLLR